jgi:hypothetical protein
VPRHESEKDGFVIYTKTLFFVIPAKAEIQEIQEALYSGVCPDAIRGLPG